MTEHLLNSDYEGKINILIIVIHSSDLWCCFTWKMKFDMQGKINVTEFNQREDVSKLLLLIQN